MVDASPTGDVGFRRALLDVYLPLYGDDWEQFLDSGPVYARIEPEKMFTFSMPAGDQSGSDPL